MLKVMCDANGIWFMGLKEGNDHVRMHRVSDPLLFKYVRSGNVNALDMAFEPFDVFAKPKEIRTFLVTCYNPSPEQARLYKEQSDIIFGIKG